MDLSHKNINIHYTSEGNGKTIVLLHGFLENLSMWDALKQHFIPNHRVVCIDLLGHGQTGCLGYVHTMEMMAEAVYEILNHLKIQKAVMVGHSMGGYVALAFAEAYPKLLNGLVLMNSTALPDSEEKKANRDRAIAAVKQNHKTFVRLSIKNLFRPKNRKIFPSEVKKVTDEALKTPVQGVVAALEGMKIRPDRSMVFIDGNFSKGMIIGRKDPVLEPATLRQLAQAADAKWVEFPDGHMSHIENFTHFIEFLGNFLKSI